MLKIPQKSFVNVSDLWTAAKCLICHKIDGGKYPGFNNQTGYKGVARVGRQGHFTRNVRKSEREFSDDEIFRILAKCSTNIWDQWVSSRLPFDTHSHLNRCFTSADLCGMGPRTHAGLTHTERSPQTRPPSRSCPPSSSPGLPRDPLPVPSGYPDAPFGTYAGRHRRKRAGFTHAGKSRAALLRWTTRYPLAIIHEPSPHKRSGDRSTDPTRQPYAPANHIGARGATT